MHRHGLWANYSCRAVEPPLYPSPALVISDTQALACVLCHMVTQSFWHIVILCHLPLFVNLLFYYLLRVSAQGDAKHVGTSKLSSGSNKRATVMRIRFTLLMSL